MRIWRANFWWRIFPPKKGPFEERAKGSRRQSRTPGVSRGRRSAEHHGALSDGLKDAEYNPHSAVCKLPQPRMLDKLLSRLVDDAVNLAVERDEARLAARGIAEGTEVLTPSKVVPDVGGVTRRGLRRRRVGTAGNDEGELVVVNASSGSVASRTRVLAGSIAAVDAVAVDPPPPPPPRPPTPPPEDTAGEGNEGAEGDDAEGADAMQTGPRRRSRRKRTRRLRRGDGDDEGGAAALAGLALDDTPPPPVDYPRRTCARSTSSPSPASEATWSPSRRTRDDGEDRGSEWSSTPVVAAGDAPVTRRSDETDDRNDAAAWSPRENVVATARPSPDGTALAVTCGGGALAVYAVAAAAPRRRLSSRRTTTTTTTRRGGGGDGDGDDGQGRGDAVKGKARAMTRREREEGAAEGEEGVAGEGVGREGESPTSTLSPRRRTRRGSRALTWLPADAAAQTFGPFHRERDDPRGCVTRARAGANEGERFGFQNPRWIRTTEEPRGRRRSASTHLRPRGRGVRHVARRQSARDVPARRRDERRPRGWRSLRRCGARASRRRSPRGRTRGWTPRPSRQPRRGWTLPFPVSAAASGDGGALLALAMIDGSVVLFNARLGAVAKRFGESETTVRASTATTRPRRQLCTSTTAASRNGRRTRR